MSGENENKVRDKTTKCKEQHPPRPLLAVWLQHPVEQAGNPAGSRRLLRCALAFPPGLCRRRRQFLQGARPLRSIRKELVGEDDHGMTGTCCGAINST